MGEIKARWKYILPFLPSSSFWFWNIWEKGYDELAEGKRPRPISQSTTGNDMLSGPCGCILEIPAWCFCVSAMLHGWLFLSWVQQIFTYSPVVAQSEPVSGSQTCVSTTIQERHGNPWAGSFQASKGEGKPSTSKRGMLHLPLREGHYISVLERDTAFLS